MKKLFLLLSVSLLLFIVSGCSSVKRHKSAEWKGQDNSLVDMELFGASLGNPALITADKNLWDLSASAQAELVRILNERYPDNEQFIGALGNEYLTEGFKPSPNFTNKDLRMVFTISKKREYRDLNETSTRFSQADRIEYLKFSLELPPECNLGFKEWNRYATEYGEVEIADVSFSTSLNLEADGVVKQTDTGGKASFSRDEQQVVRTRYLKLNGSISDQVISIEEEGTREIDLTGNVIADVSLEFAGFPERIYFPVFANTELSSLRHMDVQVPLMEEVYDTIKATLTLEYVYRHVQSGSRTFAEWDDQVEYYTGTVRKQVPLFQKDDYLPGFYCIADLQDERDLLKIRQGEEREYLLQFMTYKDALRVLEWLEGLKCPDEALHEPLIIGNSTCFFKGKVLSGADAMENSWRIRPVY
ncbi:MAG: hypothetical protein ABFS28_09040 [Bacteroidota bacterium]